MDLNVKNARNKAIKTRSFWKSKFEKSKNPTRAIIQLETVSISTIAKNVLIQYVLRIM